MELSAWETNFYQKEIKTLPLVGFKSKKKKKAVVFQQFHPNQIIFNSMLKITAINTLQNHGRHFPYLEGPDFFANQAPLTVEERKNLSSPLRDSSSSSSASSPKVLLRSVSTESTGSINSVDHTSQENRKIVGNERDGSFLVVYERKDVESKNKKTFFDLWYPNLTNVLTPVFKSSSTNIVGASLSQFDRDSSESRPLWAAFTVVRNLPQPPEEMKKKNLGPIVYESHIVELIYPEDRFSTYASTTGRHFINHNKKEEGKRELQRVQFLSSSSKKSTWYLYLREGREDSAAEIYSVNNIQKTEPQYRGLIADKFLWCEFDSNKEQLFVLTNRNSKVLVFSLNLKKPSFFRDTRKNNSRERRQREERDREKKER